MDTTNLKNIGAMKPPLAEDRRIELLAGVADPVPAQLLELYSATDGFLTPRGHLVYEAADLAERNETFEVRQYSPGYLLIGDDSGGRGYLLKLDASDPKVYSSDLGDLGPEDFEVEAESLAIWIARIG